MDKELYFKNRMSKSTGYWLKEAACALMAALFIYTATAKLLDYDRNRGQMLIQVFPVWMAEILAWLIPIMEIVIALLLCFRHTRLIGIYSFLLLMSSFSIYIILIMLSVFEKTPCSCGGFISKMSWGTHLVFNLFFILVALLTLNHYQRKEVQEED